MSEENLRLTEVVSHIFQLCHCGAIASLQQQIHLEVKKSDKTSHWLLNFSGDLP